MMTGDALAVGFYVPGPTCICVNTPGNTALQPLGALMNDTGKIHTKQLAGDACVNGAMYETTQDQDPKIGTIRSNNNSSTACSLNPNCTGPGNWSEYLPCAGGYTLSTSNSGAAGYFLLSVSVGADSGQSFTQIGVNGPTHYTALDPERGLDMGMSFRAPGYGYWYNYTQSGNQVTLTDPNTSFRILKNHLPVDTTDIKYSAGCTPTTTIIGGGTGGVGGGTTGAAQN
ncbi:MAG: hypothetical protein HQL19_05185 [Candidatus Omnitrophica bacterium]|nr:hypothetical protein [Candidatus Omnitrophota bacterium]